MSITRKALANPAMQSMISVARKLWFAGRHERVTLGGHRLRYVPGSRPTRLKYRDDPDLIVRNDVRQLGKGEPCCQLPFVVVSPTHNLTPRCAAFYGHHHRAGR